MQIKRTLESVISKKSRANKAVILLGARQVGKTTLLKTLFPNSKDVLWINADEPDVQRLFENLTSTRLKSIFGNKKIIVIDEAQKIENIGLKLKLITDQIPRIRLIATGSSSFDLANKVNEPLTGRKWEYKLFPLTFGELTEHFGLLEEKRMIPHRLVYGTYPEIVTNPGEEKNLLKQLTESYLYKDVLMWEQIKKPERVQKLLQAIAFQVGNQVSFTELAQLCSIDPKTVERYITLLEQAYVIFRLPSFSRNLRNELKNSRKIYFYDNGIRNALLSNFSQVENRQDVGVLWENYLVSQRLFKLNYDQNWKTCWFWRTKDQQEIDYIEEGDGIISAYEFKWNPKAKVQKLTKSFAESYTNTLTVINPDNVEEFLLNNA